MAEAPKIIIELTDKKAKMPARATDGSSGYDLIAITNGQIGAYQWKLIPVGFKMQIPPGFEAQIRSRSGLALKKGVFVLNGVGTIDSDYRNEVGVLLANFNGNEFFEYKAGDRIAQMVIARVPVVSIVQGEVNMEINRGGGFGSTGA